MAYNQFQKERIERIFKDLKTPFDIRNMMGKACFFVDEKFCIGVDIDKETGKDRLMARFGEGQMADALLNSECKPMTSS